MSDKITKLPDGSAFFTATVMSKEEALKLPLKERPLNMRISEKIYTAVFEAVGAASMCWDEPSVGVFQSEKASKVATDLCFTIANEIESLQDLLQKRSKELEYISENLCGTKVDGDEVQHDMVYALVEGEIEKQADLKAQAESKLAQKDAQCAVMRESLMLVETFKGLFEGNRQTLTLMLDKALASESGKALLEELEAYRAAPVATAGSDYVNKSELEQLRKEYDCMRENFRTANEAYVKADAEIKRLRASLDNIAEINNAPGADNPEKAQ